MTTAGEVRSTGEVDGDVAVAAPANTAAVPRRVAPSTVAAVAVLAVCR